MKTSQGKALHMMLPVRRSLAVMIAALLAGVFAAAGLSAPASAAASGLLKIVSVTDDASGLGWPVQDKTFKVAVTVVNSAGKSITVSEDTDIVLAASGPGDLNAGNTTATILANSSGATISGAQYSQSANGVVLTVSAKPGGARLSSAKVTVEIAVTAVGKDASPRTSLQLTDQTCIQPTAEVPTCGQFLLPHGASNHVTLSVGDCDGLADCLGSGDAEALVVTAIADLKDESGNPLYTESDPATVVVACDKTVCRQTANGVPKLPVLYTFNNTGPLTEKADPCPSKGRIGLGQKACVDYVQSSRQDGDLYLYVLFLHDARFSI